MLLEVPFNALHCFDSTKDALKHVENLGFATHVVGVLESGKGSSLLTDTVTYSGSGITPRDYHADAAVYYDFSRSQFETVVETSTWKNAFFLPKAMFLKNKDDIRVGDNVTYVTGYSEATFINSSSPDGKEHSRKVCDPDVLTRLVAKKEDPGKYLSDYMFFTEEVANNPWTPFSIRETTVTGVHDGAITIEDFKLIWKNRLLDRMYVIPYL